VVGSPDALVLVVDDEPYITDLVGMALRYEGYDVTVAANGREALSRAMERRPDIVVLDVALPDFTGLDVCERLRQQADLPIVFLTAKDATEDKIAGLRAGGDDYVTKPFNLDELIARIHAVLRRARPETPSTELSYADLKIDEATFEARRAGIRLDLTRTEFKLLSYLVRNAGRLLSKTQILDYVWNDRYGGSDNVVEVYVSYLRKKLGPGPHLIHTVRGVGYVFRVPSD
jgi:two-component system OmpR family response regulator